MDPIVKVKRLRESSPPLPSYQSEHAAGIDLIADIDEALTLAPLARAVVNSPAIILADE